MYWCLSFHNKVQFRLAKGNTSTRLNFGMCQNVKPEGPFACLCCFCKHAQCQLCKMSLLPEAGQETAPCLPTLGYPNLRLWLPSVITARCCTEKIKLLAKSIDLKGEMEVYRDVPGLNEILTRSARSSVNKRHVYPIATSWLLHEQCFTNLKNALKPKSNQKSLILLDRFAIPQISREFLGVFMLCKTQQGNVAFSAAALQFCYSWKPVIILPTLIKLTGTL